MHAMERGGSRQESFHGDGIIGHLVIRTMVMVMARDKRKGCRTEIFLTLEMSHQIIFSKPLPLPQSGD